MPVSIKLPKSLTDVTHPKIDIKAADDKDIASIKKICKTLIERAISEKLVPSKVLIEHEYDFVGHITINILPKFNRSIIMRAREGSCSTASIALGYLTSAINQDWHLEFAKLNDNDSLELADHISSIGYTPRKEQGRFYSYVEDSIKHNKLGIVEASTGVGKTLAILISASKQAIDNNAVCVIATNTVNNLMSYYIDHRRLESSGKDIASLCIVLGRQNFVSVNLLNKWMNNDNVSTDKGSVSIWLDNQRKHDINSLSAPPFTIESLVQVCPQILPSEITLSTYEDKEDEGALAYASQFEKARDMNTGILIVSQSMLCIDIRMRLLRHGLDGEVASNLETFGKKVSVAYQTYLEASEEQKEELLFAYLSLSRSYLETKMAELDEAGTSLLPNYQFLYVDEGHLLESSMANTISENISIKKLLREVSASVEKGDFPRSRFKEAQGIVENLIEKGSLEKQEQLMLGNQTPEFNASILRLCETLSGARKRKGNESWLDVISQLRSAIGNKRQDKMAILSFSPVRSYPQINAGEIDCSRYLKALWARVEAAVVVSATLYIKRYNAYSCQYMKRLLSIEDSRLAEYPPVHASFIKNTVECVYLPDENSDNVALMPVGRQFSGSPEEKEQAQVTWCKSLSLPIVNAYQSSPGGVIVLMTSYKDVELLAQSIPSNIPLVYASGNNSLADQKAAFLTQTKSGRKPLWLTLGGAWVGMDISGKDIGLSADEIGEKDNVLTTLIIPKIPFGLNMSLSHKLRTLKSGRSRDNELMDTLMRLKQGIGRLVRLEGQPSNRSIYLLDGRFNHPRYRGYLSPVKALLETYPKIEFMK